MGELVKFNKLGWVVVGLGMALGLWSAASCSGASCSDERGVIFLIFGSLSFDGGLFISILSNEVEEEVLWKRILAALMVAVATVVVAMVIALQVIFTGGP